jgi:ubiquinone/menaquinone biosynthesis C-methylase UbiE
MKQQSQKVKRHFDDVSDVYGNWYYKDMDILSYYSFNVRKDKILKMITNGGRVLDVGCGPGIMLKDLVVDRGAEFHGIDISDRMIEEARKMADRMPAKGKVSFSVGGAEKLDFPDDYFDLVLAMGLVEYLDEPRKAIKEVARVAKPGGEIIITYCHKNGIYNRLFRYYGTPVKHLYHAMRNTPFIFHKMYTEESARELVEGTGLREAGLKYYAANVVPFPLNYLAKSLTVGLSRRFEHSRHKWAYTGFFVKYVKE